MTKGARQLGSPAVMWFMVASGSYALFQIMPSTRVIPVHTVTELLVIPAGICWLYFFTGALRVNRQAARAANKITELITWGVYAKVRHPIYVGDIVLACGAFFIYPTISVLAVVMWLTLVLAIWMRIEEYELIQRFGQDYEEYRKNVPMLIPRFR